MRKSKIHKHVGNMKAIFEEYKSRAKDDPDGALQYFFMMVATELARFEHEDKIDAKPSEEIAQLEKILNSAKPEDFGLQPKKLTNWGGGVYL